MTFRKFEVDNPAIQLKSKQCSLPIRREPSGMQAHHFIHSIFAGHLVYPFAGAWRSPFAGAVTGTTMARTAAMAVAVRMGPSPWEG